LPGWRNLPTGRQVDRRTGLKILWELFIDLVEIMYFVYAIKSTCRNYYYIGLTDNINRRVNEHNTGKNKTTKPYRPFELIYVEEYESRAEARVREKYLKSGAGKEFLKKFLPGWRNPAKGGTGW